MNLQNFPKLKDLKRNKTCYLVFSTKFLYHEGGDYYKYLHPSTANYVIDTYRDVNYCGKFKVRWFSRKDGVVNMQCESSGVIIKIYLQKNLSPVHFFRYYI